jgi:hypothetical protein
MNPWPDDPAVPGSKTESYILAGTDEKFNPFKGRKSGGDLFPLQPIHLRHWSNDDRCQF